MDVIRSDNPLIRFVLALSLAALAGLAYGWLVQPVEFVQTAPDSLRQDYRSDYVLMVAEAYSDGQDLEMAQRRLAALGPQPPTRHADAALEYARQQGFAAVDIDRLEALQEDLLEAAETPQIGGP